MRIESDAFSQLSAGPWKFCHLGLHINNISITALLNARFGLVRGRRLVTAARKVVPADMAFLQCGNQSLFE